MAAALAKLDRWLRQRPLGLALFIAAIVAYAVSADDIVAEDVLPFGDGERYAMRCFSLYGFLHSGQWAQFWDLFTLPKQSLLLPHELLFFLLPKGVASLTTYGALQAGTTYGLLALGAWQLCRVLGRAEWTPALLLFCAINNVSIDFSFFYFADMPFTAVGMLVLAWQITAWREPGRWRSVLSGAGLGMLYWIKAPNALIFTVTFLIAESARLVLASSPERKPAAVARHVIFGLAAFSVAAGSALVCGGFQSIIRQINENEVSDIFVTKLECTGLLRLFYFPLCLTYFYHAIVMLIVFSAAVLLALRLYRRASAENTRHASSKFPWPLLTPLIIAYLVLGEFYSFGEASKGIRSLLLVLPVMWLSIFALMERINIRPSLVFIAAALYSIGAFAQIFSNAFGTQDLPTEGYQLRGDWLGRLPQPHFLGGTRIETTQYILKTVRETLPEGGKVAVGSELMYVTAESLTWAMQREAALRGEKLPYKFENCIDLHGLVERRALVGSRGVLLYLQFEMQYSREVLAVSNALVQYGVKNWSADGPWQLIPLRDKTGKIWGCYIFADEPFTETQVDALLKGAGAGVLPPGIELNPPLDRRLTWAECRDILIQWEEKRLGVKDAKGK